MCCMSSLALNIAEVRRPLDTAQLTRENKNDNFCKHVQKQGGGMGLEFKDRAKIARRWGSAIIRRTPIISGLPDLSLKHHGDAFKETAVTVVLATIPLWLGAFIAALLDGSKSLDGSFTLLAFLFEKIRLTTESGALIIYASSLISPVLYMALNERSSNSPQHAPFPSKISHIMAVLMISIISTAYFTADIAGNKLNASIAYYTSIWLFAFAVLVLYIASCYKNFSSEYSHSDVLKAEATDFESEFRMFRRSNT